MHREKNKKIKECLEVAYKALGVDPAVSAASVAYRALKAAGHECYLVGGCVRDALLGRACHDIDLCTDATPEEMTALEYGVLAKIKPTGIKHGTVTLVCVDEKTRPYDSVEITTYRADGKYADHRHPDEVRFSKSLEEDLRRRDFTMNALAYDLDTEEIVCLNESDIGDLESGVIRAVGDPEERFEEDALRMLRAIRFEAQLGFYIEENTAKAICHKAKLLDYVSPERIRDELGKILLSERPEALKDLCGGLAYSIGYYAVGYADTLEDKKSSSLYRMAHKFSDHNLGFAWYHGQCLSPRIFGGLREGVGDALLAMASCDQRDPRHYADVLTHTIDVIKGLEAAGTKDPTEIMSAWAALFHDIGKPCVKEKEGGVDRFIGHEQASAEIWKAFAERYRFDSLTADGVYKLVLNHHRDLSTPKAIRKTVNLLGKGLTWALIDLQKADAKAHTRPEERLLALERAEDELKYILAKGQATSLGSLEVDGKDLIAMGFRPGKEMGDLLRALLCVAIAYPELNTKEKLERIACEYSLSELPERFPFADF